MPPQTRPTRTADPTVVTLEVDGTAYLISLEDIPATISFRVRRETGSPLAWWLNTLAETGQADIDAAAILVWVARLQAGETVTLDEVLASITYGTQLGAPTDEVAAELADAEGNAPAGDTPA